ncbi:MAG: epoxyqueuosine reductase QueH [bacterium]|nr:epoxyqueuosine reductase QueH [bacterium]
MNNVPTPQSRASVLLHVCCAPCAPHPIELLQQQYRVTLFFSNSNIAPRDEYLVRLQHVRRLVSIYHLELIEDEYDHTAWLEHVRGLEDEPERGARCVACFAFSLRRAGEYAAQHGFDAFTTTLTVSPHKATEKIFAVGQRFANFLPLDFKKQDGYARSTARARQHHFYRQEYCGCEFSQKRHRQSA